MSTVFDDFDKVTIPNYGYVRLPTIPIPEKWYDILGIKKEDGTKIFFEKLVKWGYEKKKPKFNSSKIQQYEERLVHELKTLDELGFTDYCLLVWVVIEKARELGAFIDYGRGSMVSSLCFFVLDITGADPIEYELIFERFVNKARSKKIEINGVTYLKGDLVADADLNLGQTRDAVKDWLMQVYPGQISSIVTLGTFTGKSLVTDVHKCYDGVTPDDAKKISDLVEKHQGIVEDIEKMPEKSVFFKQWTEKYPKTYKIALKLRDLIANEGKHASGYLIADRPLYGYVPLQLNKDGNLACGFTKEDAAEFALKLDLLGLATNSLLKKIESVIPEKLEDITEKLRNDPDVYKYYQNGDLLPYGLYQISAETAYRVLNKFKPKNILELSDVSATARPGALAYVDDYVANNKPCPHPAFEEILKPTRNNCLYQEQFLRMAMKLGFTGEEAEQIRRVVGKKKVDEINAWKSKIYAKAKENGFDDTIGDILWKILEESSRYSFNKSHSVATSLTSALTTYLKYKYPLQFYWACLSEVKNISGAKIHDEIAAIEREIYHFGIKLLPPDLVLSSMDFKIEGKNIRYGLSFIKGISDKTIEDFQKFISIEKYDKVSVLNALSETLDTGVACALAQAGCLQGLSENRPKLVLELQTYLSSNLLTDRERRLITHYLPQNNNDVLKTMLFLKTAKDEKGKDIIKESRWNTFYKKYLAYKEIWQQNSKNVDFANWFFETRLLGFSYSNTLKGVFGKSVEDLISMYEIKTEVPNVKVKGVGQVLEARAGVSKEKKKNYLKVVVADETEKITIMAFNDVYRDYMKDNKNEIPEEGAVVLFSGTKKDGDTVFCDALSLQTWQIYTKLSDITKLGRKAEKEEKT